jgi:hypothetical protein
MCDSDGNLVELTLENNNLKGELPGELILLWNSLGMYRCIRIAFGGFGVNFLTISTEVINLKGNDISGSIPTTIAGLGKLGKCCTHVAGSRDSMIYTDEPIYFTLQSI